MIAPPYTVREQAAYIEGQEAVRAEFSAVLGIGPGDDIVARVTALRDTETQAQTILDRIGVPYVGAPLPERLQYLEAWLRQLDRDITTIKQRLRT